ncbi:MAG: dephospho-CoA kinase [Candidatus Eremiobacteraeota bacterium]|nr:dephospho-CoA kinase [Candidatus Eremiobacteraeota bacterium]MBC5828553.1 dephospho-CoA kinase [Candidatus Eremiobacteraeota bacterium]
MIAGLTGAIGSGKSTVAAMLGARGATVLDADDIAREVVKPPSLVLDRLRDRFGGSVLRRDGTLDRRELSEIAFADPAAREALNGIMHPPIRERMLALAVAAPPSAIVLMVVPLLFESPLRFHCTPIVAVVAPMATRLQRVLGRVGMSAAEFGRRDGVQLNEEIVRRRADIVVDNGGNLSALEIFVEEVWQALQAYASACG